MVFLVAGLIIFCTIFIFSSVRRVLDGHIWLKWDTEKKYNYIHQCIATLERKKRIIKNSPTYYINELDLFYVKDAGNMNYDIQTVLLNLMRLHELPQAAPPTKP